MNNKILNASRFANPTVDFAFKRIFGTEKYKDATINLLNSFLTGHHVVDLTFLNSEIIGETGDSRKSAIDVLCEDVSGARFIVEMQTADQKHFLERAVFYSSKVISMTPPQGIAWDYAVPPTFVIAFLNFKIHLLDGVTPASGRYLLHYVTKEESSGSKLPGSTEYYFFGLKDFDKKESELSTICEKWIYLLSNTETFVTVPEVFGDDATFRTYFEAAERAGFTKEEKDQYTKDMMNDWDIENAKNYACEKAEAKGRAEGKAEGKAEVAKAMQKEGIPIEVICRVTGLTEEQIRNL